jgi:hypothetical protein
MKDKKDNSKLPDKQVSDEEKNKLKGYPLYPNNEDIFNKFQKEENLNPEDMSDMKKSKDKFGKNNELDFDDDLSGEDLDIPGSELDDQQENIGSEDEENNYYSIGGENHDNLEEDRGE